jgi:regulator of sirC expression with transglutaminase-like and TPR domain
MQPAFLLALLLGIATAPAFADKPDTLVKPQVLKRVIQSVSPAVATIRVQGRDGQQIGIGTGFVIDATGLIATNFHVITEGRPFTVEMPSGRMLPVLAVESSDRASDLALLRVDPGDKKLPSLKLADNSLPSQGSRVLAFGNPLGMRDSVVTGIISAIQDIEGRKLIQLAMPIQPGNSGGPLVDSQGKVIGIINMKSAIDDNLGFAIPINQLAALREAPNPVVYDRWIHLGRVNENEWLPVFDATWNQRGGMIMARGEGSGFGGRALCLAKSESPASPFEIAVRVRLDKESGAAGIAFHSDSKDRHYGFYPSNGQLRLTCFKGPSVYSWEVLQEVRTKHYLPGDWNRLRVRIEAGKLQCFVNGHMVIESNDTQLASGKCGLVKFRDTEPDFKRFEIGLNLGVPPLNKRAQNLISDIFSQPSRLRQLTAADIMDLGEVSEAANLKIKQKVAQIEKQAEQLRRLASDVTNVPIARELAELARKKPDHMLLRGSLLIAKLDDADIDIDAYLARVDEMGAEISEKLQINADANTKRDALHTYLFQENGFHGGSAEYYHPANSHLNRVIDDREGLPITLSILYMELGRRIGIETEGVGLPGHFIVRQVINDNHQKLIDVFERGKILTTDDAAKLVAIRSNRSITAADLQAQTPTEILNRVLGNLISVAGDQQDAEAINRYCEASVAIQPDSILARRMRSQIRMMTGRNAAAIEDLDWLIDHDDEGFAQTEATRLRQALLEQTEDE